MSDLQELMAMVLNFRVSELQVLLGYGKLSKSGKKQELQSRAIDLLKMDPNAVRMKIHDLHRQRFNTFEHGAGLKLKCILPHQLKSSPPPYVGIEQKMRRSLYQVPSSVSNASSSSRPVLTTHAVRAKSVIFKPLPFFEIVTELVRPGLLALNPMTTPGTGPTRRTALSFQLAAEHAHCLSVSRDVRSGADNDFRVHVRFCLLEPVCKSDDTLPYNLNIEANGSICQIPLSSPGSRPGMEPKRRNNPVDITSSCKLSPTVTNKVAISWIPENNKTYGVAVYLVNRLTSSELLQRLTQKVHIPSTVTMEIIQRKLSADADDEISTTTIKSPLICPLGKKRIEVPCRASTCSHLQCFDGLGFLQMNEKKESWLCPVCDKPVLFQNIFVDGLFSEILEKTPKDCTDVQFYENGSWSPVANRNAKRTTSHDANHRNERKIEVIDLTSDSDDGHVKRKSAYRADSWVQTPKKTRLDSTLSTMSNTCMSLKSKTPVLHTPSVLSSNSRASRNSRLHLGTTAMVYPSYLENARNSSCHAARTPVIFPPSSDETPSFPRSIQRSITHAATSPVSSRIYPSSVSLARTSPPVRMFIHSGSRSMPSSGQYPVLTGARYPSIQTVPFLPYEMQYCAQALHFRDFLQAHARCPGLHDICSYLQQEAYTAQQLQQVHHENSAVISNRRSCSTPDIISLD